MHKVVNIWQMPWFNNKTLILKSLQQNVVFLKKVEFFFKKVISQLLAWAVDINVSTVLTVGVCSSLDGLTSLNQCRGTATGQWGGLHSSGRWWSVEGPAAAVWMDQDVFVWGSEELELLLMRLMNSDQILYEPVCQKNFSPRQSAAAPLQTTGRRHWSRPDRARRRPSWIKRRLLKLRYEIWDVSGVSFLWAEAKTSRQSEICWSDHTNS